MVKFALQLRARLDNISELFIDPAASDIRYYMKLKCTGCGENFGHGDHWIYVADEENKTQNGQSANFVSKCKLCKREATIQILDKTLKPYKKNEERCEQDFGEIIQFEARGVEPLDYDIRTGWNAKSSLSSSTFQMLEFDSGSWEDYDESAVQPVGVYDVSARFVKV